LSGISGEWLFALGRILLINLILSGDNAVVIAMASRNLEQGQRRRAVLWGSGGAVVLRIILTFVAAYFLDLPYFQFAGGLALLWIGVSLLRKEKEKGGAQDAASLQEAIRVILAADLVMSLDNVLALAAIAQTVAAGRLMLLGIGLATSIPLVIAGAQALMALMDRFPLLVYAGAGVLGYTAAEMILGDKAVGPLAAAYAIWLKSGLAVLVIVAGHMLRRRKERRPSY